MQRRAAAAYFALLVVLATGAAAFLWVSGQPPVDLAGPTYGDNDTFRVGDVTYTVNATAGGAYRLRWFNASRRAATRLGNGSTIQYRNETYRVAVENGTSPPRFGLMAVQNVSALLAADPAVEDAVAEQDGTRYVFYENGSRQRLSAYLPEPERLGPYPEGGMLEWPLENATVTARVDRVSNATVRLFWPAPQNETIALAEGENVTLAGTVHFAHVPEDGGVQVLAVDEHWSDYRADRALQGRYHERRAGVWAVLVMSVIAAVVLLSVASMPVRS